MRRDCHGLSAAIRVRERDDGALLAWIFEAPSGSDACDARIAAALQDRHTLGSRDCIHALAGEDGSPALLDFTSAEDSR